MNKQRRTALGKIMDELNDIRGAMIITISNAQEASEELKKLVPDVSELESILEEEQEAFDNMPESIQNSDRGEQSQEAINNMENAIDKYAELEEICEIEIEDGSGDGEIAVAIQAAVSAFDEALSEIIDFLSDASA